MHASHSSVAGALVVKCALAKSIQILSSSAHCVRYFLQNFLSRSSCSDTHTAVRGVPKSGNKPCSTSGDWSRFWVRSAKERSAVSYITPPFQKTTVEARSRARSHAQAAWPCASVCRQIRRFPRQPPNLDTPRPHIFLTTFSRTFLRCPPVQLSISLLSFCLREIASAHRHHKWRSPSNHPP